jgi:hypothetical protein
VKFGVVFLALLAGSGAWALIQGRSTAAEVPYDSPIASNQRLTALTGLIVYVGLAAIAVTVIDISGLLEEHYLVGFLLVPPVLLKLGSTGYRFFRYYAGDHAYRLAGAPPILLRFVVAPILVASTVVVFATGLELWLFGLGFGSVWLTVHTASAAVMLLAAAAHLVAHLRRSTTTTWTDAMVKGREALSPRSLVGGSLLLGAVLAVASLLYASPFSQSVGAS